jgi:uncharacterized protein
MNPYLAPLLILAAVLTIDWEQLLPEKERGSFVAGPPPAIHDYLGEGGAAIPQSKAYGLNEALDGKEVRIPGFIVPLDMAGDGKITEFFLVPYYGACIHVPPPPPNQIVYVSMPQGLELASIYDAYWITGKMTLENRRTRLGTAAYRLDATAVGKYGN